MICSTMRVSQLQNPEKKGRDHSAVSGFVQGAKEDA